MKLLFSRKVIADVAIINTSISTMSISGKSNKKKNGNTNHNVEDVTSFCFVESTDITTEVIAINYVKLIDDTFPKPGTCVRFKPTTVSNKTDKSSSIVCNDI